MGERRNKYTIWEMGIGRKKVGKQDQEKNRKQVI